MPGSVRVGGVWTNIQTASVRVAGTWTNVLKGYVKVAGTWVQWFAYGVADTFTRANTTTGLGTSETGQAWNATQGNWFVSGNQATSSDAASTYPVTAVDLGQANAVVQVSTDGNGGVGPAFWVSAAGSYWAAVSFLTQSTYSCGCGTCCNTCANSACGCASYNTCQDAACGCAAYNACSACGLNTTTGGVVQTAIVCANNGGNYVGGTCYYPKYNACSACGCATLNSCATVGCGCASYNSCANCGACGSFSCGCSTCYTTNNYLRLISSVSGTVTTQATDVNTGVTIRGISVTTNGNAITAQAYSDASLTTAAGSPITLTPGSPVTATKHGIIKYPSTYSQGSIIDNFSATIT